jgi:hypothetical protein
MARSRMCVPSASRRDIDPHPYSIPEPAHDSRLTTDETLDANAFTQIQRHARQSAAKII